LSLSYFNDINPEYNRDQIEFIYHKIKDQELTEYEKKLLNDFDKILAEYEKTKANKESLYGIFSLLSNKNNKLNMLGIDLNRSNMNPFQGLFSESLSIKDIVNMIVKFARVKPKITSKLQKVKKGLIDSIIKKVDDNSFSVRLDESQQKVNLKRKKFISIDNRNKYNNVKTKIITYSATRKQDDKFDLFHSVLYALESGSFTQNPFKINVNPNHYRYPVYSFKQVFNIMIVLDTSNSVSWVTQLIDKVIALITNSAKNSNDKLGLITFNNEKANIIHYPTKNIHQIIGSINNTKTKGLTPLSEGLKKAVNVFTQNRYNLPGMANVIILISDCYPEPMTYKYKDLLDEPICKEFLNECEKIAENKIKFLIINPILNDSKIKADRIGNRLAKSGVEKANGEIINLKGNVSLNIFDSKNTYKLDKHIEDDIKNQISNIRNEL